MAHHSIRLWWIYRFLVALEDCEHVLVLIELRLGRLLPLNGVSDNDAPSDCISTLLYDN